MIGRSFRKPSVSETGMKTATWFTALFLAAIFLWTGNCCAQDLAPRAYLITPTHSNAVTFTYSFLDGNIQLDGNLPITGATTKTHISTLSYYHSFTLLGRSTNLTVFLPYGVGNFHGTVIGAEASAYRSGLLAPTFRISVNVIGGPAMSPKEFVTWRQKTLLGFSLRIVPSAGQYDPTKLVNLGTHRWAFKPELGYSHRSGHWILDAYGGAWFFTENTKFFSNNQFSSGTNVQKENPVGSLEGHLSYDFKLRLWVSADANFWSGGRTSLNGKPSIGTEQRNSRVGASASIPISGHQSLKFSYSDGAYIRYGGNYQTISLAWQYSWIGRPN